jgi:hypothetical protein
MTPERREYNIALGTLIGDGKILERHPNRTTPTLLTADHKGTDYTWHRNPDGTWSLAYSNTWGNLTRLGYRVPDGFAAILHSNINTDPRGPR